MQRDHRMKALGALLLGMSMAVSMLVFVPSATDAAPGDGWIEGTVTDGVDPIPNVMLIYILNMGGGGNPLGSGWTDALGHYNLTVTGGLNYLVLAFEGNHYSNMSTAVVISGSTTIADIVLTPIDPVIADVTLHGFVKDELGNPVAVGSIIGYTNDPLMTGGGPPYYGNSTVPDALGEFFVNVIPGARGGGVGIMEVPGYGFTENSSSEPFVSGMTYWLNLTLGASVSTDDAVLRGTVTEYGTGLPLENVLVNIESSNAWNENRSYSNYTFTDSLGNYQMNVTNGTSRMMYSKVGYSMVEVKDVIIDPSDTVTIDVQLRKTVATIRGNVTDKSDDSPIANAQVFLTDGMGNFTMTTTNSLGAYVLDAFAGTDLALGAQAEGYVRDVVFGNVTPGDTLWQDFRLGKMDAWLAGRVTDAITGAPIENAFINVYNGSFNEWASTNIAGDYNITAIMSGDYSISINAMNYRQFFGEVQVLPGGNVYDVQLMPWNIPDTCMLWGYVTDSTTTDGIFGAMVEVGMGPPDNGERNSTSTNDTGYYSMWIPPIVLNYVATANDHVHSEGTLNASGLTDLRLDISLDVDLWSPNMTYSQSPLENVSWTNPSFYSISVEELDPEMFALSQFMYLNSGSGLDNYYLIAMYYDGFNPLNGPSNGLPYTQFGDNYTIDWSWGAMASAGWLWNSTSQQYFGSFEIWAGPQHYNVIRAYYTNETLGSWFSGSAWFDASTGDFAWFQFEGPSQPADAKDPTGMISPSVHQLQVNPLTNSTNWIPDVMLGEWSVVDLKFQFDETVPSGMWVSVFSVSDFGKHGNGKIEFFTVDNEPPIADAGSSGWQPVVNTYSTYYGGENSTDNVGIVSYTWTFMDGGNPVVLSGAVISYTFTAIGVYNMTLEVIDGAGHSSTTSLDVNVVADQPPVADAGPDQLVLPGTVFFAGGGSDDVGIVNWTWTFIYDGLPVELWGPIPSYDFLIEGVYNITLTVTDTVGQNSTDDVQITVASVIPEFPTLLIPISGMLLLLVIAGTIRRRRQ